MNSIQGNGSTLHVVGECVNRIGKEHTANGNRKPNMSSNRVQRDKPFYEFVTRVS